MKPKLLLPAVAALALFAQKPAPEQPVNRSNARLVEVNVVVRDKNGPVAGLTQGDFTLFDKGNQQKIVSFVASNNQGAKPQPLPSNVFANRPGLEAPPAGVTVILLDSMNTSVQAQAYARTQVVKFVNETKPPDRVVLCVLGDRLHVLTDADAQAFSEDSSVENWIVRNSVVSGMDLDHQLHATTDALVALSADLRHFAGRKNLVWVAGAYPVSVDHYGSEGPPGSEATTTDAPRARTFNGPPDDPMTIDRQVFQKVFSPAMHALSYAGAAVYEMIVFGGPAAGASTAPVTSTRGTATSNADVQAGALRILVDDTGGRVSTSNDLQKALRDAITDAQVTYTLGFYADPKVLDSQFHSLKVQVARKDVTLQFRKGFVAWPEPGTVEAQRAEAIREALANPLAVDGISLMGAYEKTDQPKPGSLRATVVISAADLALQHTGDQFTGELEVVMTPRSADGKDLGTTRKAVGLKLSQAQYETAVKQGLSFSQTLEPTGGVAELRAVVCDHMSTRLGSLIMPVK